MQEKRYHLKSRKNRDAWKEDEIMEIVEREDGEAIMMIRKCNDFFYVEPLVALEESTLFTGKFEKVEYPFEKNRIQTRSGNVLAIYNLKGEVILQTTASRSELVTDNSTDHYLICCDTPEPRYEIYDSSGRLVSYPFSFLDEFVNEKRYHETMQQFGISKERKVHRFAISANVLLRSYGKITAEMQDTDLLFYERLYNAKEIKKNTELIGKLITQYYQQHDMDFEITLSLDWEGWYLIELKLPEGYWQHIIQQYQIVKVEDFKKSDLYVIAKMQCTKTKETSYVLIDKVHGIVTQNSYDIIYEINKTDVYVMRYQNRHKWGMILGANSADCVDLLLGDENLLLFDEPIKVEMILSFYAKYLVICYDPGRQKYFTNVEQTFYDSYCVHKNIRKGEDVYHAVELLKENGERDIIFYQYERNTN